MRGECSENSRAHPNLFDLAAVILIAQTPSECLYGDPYLRMFQIHIQLHCQIYLFRQLHPRTPQGLYGGQ